MNRLSELFFFFSFDWIIDESTNRLNQIVFYSTHSSSLSGVLLLVASSTDEEWAPEVCELTSF